MVTNYRTLIDNTEEELIKMIDNTDNSDYKIIGFDHGPLRFKAEPLNGTITI